MWVERRSDGTVLLECRQAGGFLRAVAHDSLKGDLAPDVYLRGVIFPEREALFELRDPFGTVMPETVSLDRESVDDLLRKVLW